MDGSIPQFIGRAGRHSSGLLYHAAEFGLLMNRGALTALAAELEHGRPGFYRPLARLGTTKSDHVWEYADKTPLPKELQCSSAGADDAAPADVRLAACMAAAQVNSQHDAPQNNPIFRQLIHVSPGGEDGGQRTAPSPALLHVATAGTALLSCSVDVVPIHGSCTVSDGITKESAVIALGSPITMLAIVANLENYCHRSKPHSTGVDLDGTASVFTAK